MRKSSIVVISALLTIFVASDVLALGGVGGHASAGHASVGHAGGGGAKAGGSVGGGGRSITIGGGGAKSAGSVSITRGFDATAKTFKGGASGVDAAKVYERAQAVATPNPWKTAPGQQRKPVTTADLDKVFSPAARADRRREYYHDWNPPPTTKIIIEKHPSYGAWDAALMWSILDDMNDDRMYYNHRDEPAWKQWRSDAESACADKDNSDPVKAQAAKDVCRKLSELDTRVAKYNGTPVNHGYVTEGVDPDIYEANNIDINSLSEIKVCTGSVGSDYAQFASTLKTVTKLKVVSVASNGSVDNLSKMASGECDIAFAQDDVVKSENLVKIFTLESLEAGILACNMPASDKSVLTLKDLSKKNTIYVGSDQTGSQHTLDELRAKSTSLAALTIDETMSAAAAVQAVTSKPGACYFSVTTPDNSLVKLLDQSKKTIMIPMYSFDFKDKKPGYPMATIVDTHYKNLTQRAGCNFNYCGTDVVVSTTSLIAPKSWTEQNSQLFNLLILQSANLKSAM